MQGRRRILGRSHVGKSAVAAMLAAAVMVGACDSTRTVSGAPSSTEPGALTADPIAYDIEPGLGRWTELQRLEASDGSPYDFFGHAVSLAGDTAVVGSSADGDSGYLSGAAYVFVRSAADWSEQAKLTATDAAGGAKLGSSVAVAGDTALIGAPYAQDAGIDVGAVYVFVRSAESWAEQQKLTANDAAAEDHFGWSVHLSGESSLVGAPGNDDGGTDSGAVYVFVRTAATWAEQQKLSASDGSADDEFGGSVSLDGETALVGARSDDSSTGAAYVFGRAATSWVEEQKLSASDGAPGDELGCAVSLAGDTALLGASAENEGGDHSGAAYVFVRAAAGWSEEQKLSASDAAAELGFGSSVSLRGEVALVGAPSESEGGQWSGAAYGFERIGTVWTQLSKLKASDPAVTLFFGFSVSLGSDTALVGAPDSWEPGANTGAAYVFRLALIQGAPCSDATQCAGEICVDGVCCDTACDGACDSCAVSGSAGTCSLLETGSGGEPSCAPYVCDGLTAACPANCVTSADCIDGTICDDSSPGQCVPPLAAGEACSRDDQCAAGHCIDGECGLDEGAPCTEDTQCVSGHCLDTVCCAEADCSPYGCGPAGQCRESCQSTAHCAPGYTCSSDGHCAVTTAAEDDTDGGCDYRAAGAGAHAGTLWSVALLAAGLWRRGPPSRRGRPSCGKQT